MSTLHTTEEAIKILLQGGVGVLPTDTVYGIVARAADEAAVTRLYELKHREQKPGTVIAANVQQLIDLGVKARYLKAVAHYWPGPISVELPIGDNLQYMHQGVRHGAFRVVEDTDLAAALLQTGPLLTSSANLPGQPHSNTVSEAVAYFGDNVDFYVDGGDLSGRAPSTVIRIIDDAIEIRRQGAIELSDTGEIISRYGCPLCRKNGLLQGTVLASSKHGYVIEASTFPGNYLIIPDHHVEHVTKLPDDWLRDFKELMAQLTIPLASYNISLNIGKDSGQTLKHLHFWIIPRQGGLPSSGKGMARLLNDLDNN